MVKPVEKGQVMLELLKSLILGNAKALVALLSAILVQSFGVAIPDEVQVSVSALIIALVVWLVPNKK